MRDRPRADSTAGDREQFRDQYTDSLRGCRKIDTIITQAILTLSGALAAFCGQNIGAGKLDRVKRGVRFTMYTNIVLGLLTFAAVYLFGDEMMKVFTKDADVVAIGKEYLLIIGGFFIIHGALNVYNGALRGAGDTLFPMITSLVCLWLIRIPSPIISVPGWDVAVSGGRSVSASQSGCS